MDKKREKMLDNIRHKVIPFAKDYLDKNNFKNYNIKNVIRYNKEIELVKRDTVNEDKKGFYLYVVKLENTDSYIEEDLLTELEFLVEEENGEIKKIHTISDLIKEYEGFESIKDVVDKTKENEERPQEEQDEELKKDSLEELEEEKEAEDKEQEEKEGSKDEKDNQRKKRKPSHVIERVNPDKAKMDYWQTVKQAFGLPEKVDTLAFAYSVSSEDKVDYADITVYMLDKDGYIIDDLDVDDYFEFDSSTGNNPTQDEVVRHEEDENKGAAQIEEHRTMIRLKAKNSEDNNTYISLEQKNDFGDYNDINAGRKTVAGTQNVEKQLETDRVQVVWDSEREKLMKSNAGIYNMNDIFDEAEKHEEHGDEEYISNLNADGNELTRVACESPYVPDTNITWEQFSKSVGNKDIKELSKEFFEEYNGNNGQDLVLKIQSKYKENNIEQVEEKEIEDEYEGRVPWDSSRRMS